jgi:hypothetical protein
LIQVKVAVPLDLAIRGLEDSMEEEGLFRVGPGLLQLKKVTRTIQAGLYRVDCSRRNLYSEIHNNPKSKNPTFRKRL